MPIPPEPIVPPRQRLRRPKPRRQPPPPRSRGQQPPTIQVTEDAATASPIQEQPQDYQNADAVFTTGGGQVSAYHYDRQPTYREQMATEANQTVTVSGPGQGGSK